MLTPNQSGNKILPITILGALIACQIANGDPLHPSVTAQKLQHFGDMPISFEPNRGQASSDAYFVSRAINCSLSLLRTGARLDVFGPDHKSVKSMNLEFVNTNTGSSTQGMDELTFKSHYFIGNDRDKWLKDVPNFAKVRYSQVWKGVDVIFYGNENRLEYDLVVAPGANPKNAAVAFPGASLLLQANGDLVVHASQGDFLQNKPIVYQMAGSRREQIPGRYMVAGQRVSFEIGKYDHSRELIIDPVISYSLGRIGGFPPSLTGTGAAVDASNTTVIAGTTPPVSVGPGLPFQSTGWIARLDAVGNLRAKVSFAASGGPVTVTGLASDSNGSAYVTGTAGGTGFPAQNGYQVAYGGNTDAFLVRIDFTPNGATDNATFVYGTYLGGNGTDSGNAVAVLNSGHVFVAGVTTSSNFPKTAGVTYQGGMDAFVTEFNTNGSGGGSLVYSWEGGGSGDDSAQGIATDSAGNAYVGGTTSSQNFQPVSATGYNTSKINANSDGFLLKLNSAAAVSYFTYFPFGPVSAVAADASANAYVTGQTNGSIPTNSVNQGFQLSGGANHAFVARFNTTTSGVSSLVYASYLAGAATDAGSGIATDGFGLAYVVGTTSSPNFPAVAALQPIYGGGATDPFLSLFDTGRSGTASVLFSSFLGGSGADSAGAVGLTPNHNPVIVGTTSSPNIGNPPDGNSDQRAFSTTVVFEAPPFGHIDTPANNVTGRAGAIGFTGWALSRITIGEVALCREALPGEPAINGLVFLGDAVLVPGARPDIAAAFPGYPHNDWGWGAQVLTNELPGTNGQPLGNGTYKLHAIAADPEGVSSLVHNSRDCACTQRFCTDLGTTTISVDNAHSILPFGTIDTPTEGQIISGKDFVNFGWVMTPQPNIIPQDGSTITVYIDNQAVGHPTYNLSRCDLGSLFPGLKNSGSADCMQNGFPPGPVGFFHIDTTKLSNGIHNIAWGVTDSAGNGQGIGSRAFFVQN
jgi:Beta-propeller repeat